MRCPVARRAPAGSHLAAAPCDGVWPSANTGPGRRGELPQRENPDNRTTNRGGRWRPRRARSSERSSTRGDPGRSRRQPGAPTATSPAGSASVLRRMLRPAPDSAPAAGRPPEWRRGIDSVVTARLPATPTTVRQGSPRTSQSRRAGRSGIDRGQSARRQRGLTRTTAAAPAASPPPKGRPGHEDWDAAGSPK